MKARQEPLLENRGTITFESRGRYIDLVATSTYKHVGTLTCSSDSLQPEISVKLAAMTNTFKHLRTAFLNRTAVPTEKRLLLSQSVLLTEGLFQASTWPTLYSAEVARVHKAIMQIYASILGAGMNLDERPSHLSISQEKGFVA